MKSATDEDCVLGYERLHRPIRFATDADCAFARLAILELHSLVLALFSKKNITVDQILQLFDSDF